MTGGAILLVCAKLKVLCRFPSAVKSGNSRFPYKFIFPSAKFPELQIRFIKPNLSPPFFFEREIFPHNNSISRLWSRHLNITTAAPTTSRTKPPRPCRRSVLKPANLSQYFARSTVIHTYRYGYKPPMRLVQCVFISFSDPLCPHRLRISQSALSIFHKR